MFTATQIHQNPIQGSLPLNIQPKLFQPLLHDQMGSCVRRLAGDYLGTIECRWTTWGLLWDYLGGSFETTWVASLGLLGWVAPLGPVGWLLWDYCFQGRSSVFPSRGWT